jgi:hypothetical protein
MFGIIFIPSSGKGYWIFGMALGSLFSVLGKEKIHALFLKMQNTKMDAFGIISASLHWYCFPLCMHGMYIDRRFFCQKRRNGGLDRRFCDK